MGYMGFVCFFYRFRDTQASREVLSGVTAAQG